MRTAVIILNILFYITANLVFPAIHHLHNHYDLHPENECQECLIFDNSKNYILDSQKINLKLFKSSTLINKNISAIEFEFNKKYLSRAPPYSL